MFKSGCLKKRSVILVLSVILGAIVGNRYWGPTVNAAPKGLMNSAASPEAQNVYDYICSIYGKGILAGQQESTRVNNNPNDEMEYIQNHTGKLPAIRGLDYINNDFDGVTDRALAWWDKGGIPAIGWHWGAPPPGIGSEAGKLTIDINQALTPGTALNTALLAAMDRVAEELKKLRDAKVPVLWRPYHEFDGAWFWWLKGGAAAFKKLWILMYDRFTNMHQLNNLIWVFGYSGEVKSDWYPGDAYVDIAGAATDEAGTSNSPYRKVKNVVGADMPLCFYVCRPMPDPEAMLTAGTKWVWFLTWPTIHSKEQNAGSDLRKIYKHPYVITLDKLPDLKVSSGSNRPALIKTAPTTPIPTVTNGDTAAVAPPASQNADYTVNYAIVNDWSCGATVTVTIKNNGSTPLDGWTLSWTFPGDQIIANLWDGIVTQNKQLVTIKSVVYNGTVAPNGGTASFGFNLRYNDSNAKPTGFTLNGKTCQLE